MNRKAKKIASIVLGTALASATLVSCSGSKSSCGGMNGKSSCSDKEAKKASCGASGCGSKK